MQKKRAKQKNIIDSKMKTVRGFKLVSPYLITILAVFILLSI